MTKEAFVDILTDSVIIAAISVFYEYLLRPNQLLYWWRNILVENSEKYPLLAKPLGACIYCFNGQLALCYSLYAVYTYETPIYLSIIFISHIILVFFIKRVVNI